MQVFECVWTSEVTVTVDFHAKNTSRSTLRIRPGLTAKSGAIKMQLEAVVEPKLPSVAKNFLSDEKNVVILEPEEEREIASLKCPSRKAAKELQCSLERNACSCEPTRDMVSCRCTDGSRGKALLEERAFPQSVDGVAMEVTKEGDVHVTMEMATPTIRLELQDLKVEAMRRDDAVSCELEEAELEGGRLSYICLMSHGQAIGTLRCKDREVPLVCLPNKAQRNTTMILPDVETGDLRCDLSCPASTITVKLKVTVKEWSWGAKPIAAIQSVPVIVEKLFNWPDFGPLKEELLIIILSALVIYLFAWGVCLRRQK